MCFDLEECSDIFCALFQLIFKIVKYVVNIFGDHALSYFYDSFQ